MKGEILPRDAGDLDQVRRDPYTAAVLTWLQGKAENTRRSYLRALRELLSEKHPREIEALDVAAWKEALKRRGLADSTVAQRLSAVSSYYSYLVAHDIHDTNPVDAIDRGDLDVNPYERARKLSLEDFRRIFEVIPTDNEIGTRDRALLLFYVVCARRRSEVVNLRGRDLRNTHNGDPVQYRARLKGGATKWKQLPPPVWWAIRHYLNVAGRDPEGDEPVFTATTDAGRYLREYYGKPNPAHKEPLTGEAVAQALKRYAAEANVDPSSVTVHSLRHLGAELYYGASGDVRETQRFLDHKRMDTTSIYLEQLEGTEHRHWQAMVNELGV